VPAWVGAGADRADGLDGPVSAQVAPTSLLPVLGFGEDAGVQIDLPRLIGTRLLIQAASGGGKSWAMRSLLEQLHGLVQQFILDWEGEFATLRERFAYALVGGEGADLPARPETAAALCRRLLELGVSAVLDLSSLRVEERQSFAEAFLGELMRIPRALWRPLIVAIDEAHLLCPEAGQGEASSRQAVIDLCTLGRKRGFCAVLATQRIAKVSNHALAELGNVLIGPTSFTVDVRRAAETLGFGRGQAESLKRLDPGQFWAFGPAVSREPLLVRTGAVLTSHPEPGGIAPPAPPAPEAIRSLLSELGDLSPASDAEGEASAAPCDHGVIDALLLGNAEALDRLERERDVALAQLWEAQHEREERSARQRRAYGVLYGMAQSSLTDLTKLTAELARRAGVGDDGFLTSGEADSSPAEPAAAPDDGTSAPELAAPLGAVPEASGGAPEPLEASAPELSARNVERSPVGRILDACAALERVGFERPLDRLAVAVLAGFSPTGGHFGRLVRQMVERGELLSLRGGLALSEEGWARARELPIEGLDHYQALWLLRLDGAPLRVFEALLEGCPRGEPAAREALAQWAGLTADGGHYGRALRRLRDLGFVWTPSRGEVQASALLYPPGLR